MRAKLTRSSKSAGIVLIRPYHNFFFQFSDYFRSLTTRINFKCEELLARSLTKVIEMTQP